MGNGARHSRKSTLYADGTYNRFDLEDGLKEGQMTLLAKCGCIAKIAFVLVKRKRK